MHTDGVETYTASATYSVGHYHPISAPSLFSWDANLAPNCLNGPCVTKNSLILDKCWLSNNFYCWRHVCEP